MYVQLDSSQTINLSVNNTQKEWEEDYDYNKHTQAIDLVEI